MRSVKAVIAAIVALLAIPLAVAVALGIPQEAPSQVFAPATPSATPAHSTPPPFRPASSATAVPASSLVAHANPFLGYSIGFPASYRRALSVVDGEGIGSDFFVPRSEQAERDLCATRQGSADAPERVADVRIVANPNPAGTSPVDFANAPSRRIAFTTVESTTVAGFAAARVVHQPSGDTAYYVISANGRLYEIAPYIMEQPTTQPKGWLDQIASSFKTVPVQVTATTPPNQRQLCRD